MDVLYERGKPPNLKLIPPLEEKHQIHIKRNDLT